MKILILGCKGQLGRCLYDQLQHDEYTLDFTSRKDIDITNFSETRKKILKICPDVIINASAYTDVEKAQTDKKTANLINNLAVDNIAHICRNLNCWFIHISTDYVFDGKNDYPYNEDHIVNPQTVYGISKLKGEIAIQERCESFLIIRTSWLFSEYGNNFLKTMIALGQKKNKLTVVEDQLGCPTYAQDLAIAISLILKKLHTEQLKSRIYHFCGDKPCTWFDFAQAIFFEAKAKGFDTPNNLEATSSDAYNSKTNRPKFSVLDCSRIFAELNISPSDWLSGIKSSLNRL